MKCNAAVTSVHLFFLLIVLTMLSMSQASAATYNLTPPNRPALCSGNQGSWNGTTYTCTWNQPFSLQQGDVITSSTAITIHSNNGVNLTGVTLGNSSNPITLTAESGRTIQLNNSVLYSSIGGGSTQDVVLTNNTTVHGNISVSGTVQSTNSTVMGTITSSNGAVTFTGGQAFGRINVQCCKVTVSGGAVIHAGILAGNNGINISNSTVTGDLSAGNNEIILTNVTMLSGNISAGSNNVTINGGDITANVTNSNRVFVNNGAEVHGNLQARYLVEVNDSTIYGDIETTDNFPEGLHHVKLTDSIVYGNVTVRTDWGTITGNWPDSAIYGDCDYKSVTPSLCQAAPPPAADTYWKFDEAQWTGASNQVLDSSVNLRHGTARYGAATSVIDPSPASCTFGTFLRGSSSSNNPHVYVEPNAYFHNADDFGFALWLKMNASQQSGNRQVILAYGDEDGVEDDDDGRFELLRTSAGRLRFAVRMQSEDLRYVEVNGSGIFDGQWKHIAVSYSKQNKRLRLYVNNVLVSNTPNATIGNGNSDRTPNDGDTGLSIGALPDGDNGIRGQIDEVKFFAHEPTAAEIQAMYQQTASCTNECFNENFTSDTNWYLTQRNSTPPSLRTSPSRLRLTENIQNQSTSITFKRSFPAAGNKMTIEFDHYAYGGGTNGADGIALVLSDAAVTPVPGSYGGSLGYAQRTNVSPAQSGFAGGWLGIGFDEYGSFSQATEGRVGGTVARPNAIGVRAASSTSYGWLGGTDPLLPALSASGSSLGRGDRYRITIDSTASSSTAVAFQLERRLAGSTTYSTLLNSSNLLALGQPVPPANLLLSYTGSTGDNTNFHEITNIQVCTQKPSTPIELGNQVHHFELVYVNKGLTCEAEAIEIKACANSSCSVLAASPVSTTISATNGGTFVGGNNLTFTGSTTVYLRQTNPGDTTLSLTGAANPTVCTTTGCKINFSNAGFKFYRDKTSTAGIANQIAAVKGGGYLRAVKTNTDTMACEARTTGTRNVAMSFDCSNPISCVPGQTLKLTDNTTSATTSTIFNGSEAGLIKNVSLTFDNQGFAPLGIEYSDVGQLRLSASLSLPAAGNNPAVTLSGFSDFVVRPYRINVTNALFSDTSDPANPVNTTNPQSLGTGPGFIAAGDPFQLDVSAVNALGAITPNYGNETTAPETVAVEFGQLVHPAGGVDGTFTQGATFTKITNGMFNSSGFSWNEAGSFSVLARVADNDYLGTGSGAAFSSVPYIVGRFYPKHYTLASSTLENSCAAFTYMGQPAIKLAYELQARNFAGEITQNYGPAYGVLAVPSVVLENADNGTSLSSRINVPASSWVAGEYKLMHTDLSFSKQALPDGPYSSLKAGIQITDDLDGRSLEVKDMDPTSAGACGSSCVAAALSGTLDMRYGRFALLNASGPEDEDLPIVLQSQYWNGSRFERNLDDSCSLFAAANLNVTGITTLKGGTSGTMVTGQNPFSGIFIPAPGVPGNATMQYQIPPALNYLQFPWNGGTVLTNPAAEAQFGRYQGNKRQIFWQERLN
jgi:MSHA biogenesis protein MshQ